MPIRLTQMRLPKYNMTLSHRPSARWLAAATIAARRTEFLLPRSSFHCAPINRAWACRSLAGSIWKRWPLWNCCRAQKHQSIGHGAVFRRLPVANGCAHRIGTPLSQNSRYQNGSSAARQTPSRRKSVPRLAESPDHCRPTPRCWRGGICDAAPTPGSCPRGSAANPV